MSDGITLVSCYGLQVLRRNDGLGLILSGTSIGFADERRGLGPHLIHGMSTILDQVADTWSGMYSKKMMASHIDGKGLFLGMASGSRLGRARATPQSFPNGDPLMGLIDLAPDEHL